jgi:3-hydroxyacyl-CoA dehydrogenase
MGAQIAAHLVNAGIDTVLFELAGPEDSPNGLVEKAIAGLRKLKPAPLATPAVADLITPANYDEHLELLRGCDIVIEAIAERLDWKKDLYEKVAPHIPDHAIFASNTSGLAISELVSVLPGQLAGRFCGVHFFNPPRYMHLVELIPHPGTRPEVLDFLESFLTSAVGKGVVRARDTVNFIGNRIGVFSMLSTMVHTDGFKLGFDTVDALTGPAIGRPKSATYRTADVVGLDTMGHVMNNMRDALQEDPWHRWFSNPEWLTDLIEKGSLGQKTRIGFYRKQGKVIEVLNRDTGEYAASDSSLPEAVSEILRIRDPGEKFAALRSSEHVEAQFLWALFRDLFHYCAYFLDAVADSAREIDQAIRWGYGWQQGPFEIWQSAGWQRVANWIREDIESGASMSTAALPDWVFDGRDGVHSDRGSWSASNGTDSPRSELPVYRRQIQPQRLLGESTAPGKTIREDDSVRLWTADDAVAILSFKTKKNTIGAGVLAGIASGVVEAEQNFAGLVICQTGEPFSFGADLTAFGEIVKQGNKAELERYIADFQSALMTLKYAQVPTVAGLRGMALGGGCETIMSCARTVAAHESYMGLVEAGVGLLPAGGGCKEMAIRTVENSPGDSWQLLQQAFQNIAMGKVASSAAEARDFGYLRPADVIVMHPGEVLHVAIQQARAMYESGYRPPLRNRSWAAAGDVGISTLKMLLVNMQAGEFISEHDYEVSSRIASVLCGGEIDRGTAISEDWLLALERKNFVELVFNEKTQARIMHTLKTGKPLRN